SLRLPLYARRLRTALVDGDGEVAAGVGREASVGEGRHRAGERLALGGAGGYPGATEDVSLGNRGGTRCRRGRGTGGVVGEGHRGREGPLVGIGVAAADGEGATRAGDDAGVGGAVAPVDGGREGAGRVGGEAGVGERRHCAAEAAALGDA